MNWGAVQGGLSPESLQRNAHTLTERISHEWREGVYRYATDPQEGAGGIEDWLNGRVCEERELGKWGSFLPQGAHGTHYPAVG